ncbi:hypothetical protein [Alcanivorax sediminis]|uniref:Uncharacterized protein n=1 Tax=Alcanivorax sediminis TaxID=2663008 RepID=A0A6N7LXS9_9GAMM|nr:hypothetical protein [Alcanivorax sediminis]MQX53925.1 hypothetical protein [Alcanivorax sediminis]
MNYPDFLHHEDVASLSSESSVKDITEAMNLSRKLKHWLDRSRAIDVIALRTETSADLLKRLLPEIGGDPDDR